MRTQTEITQKNLTPQSALSLLQHGNERFVSNLKVNRNLQEQVLETSAGQFPFAAILSCIDSRVPAELVFDQGIGDIFSIRIAGNILNEDILGSMEFSCKLAGSKVVVVLGHSECGAVKGACDEAKLGHLTGLLKKMQPALKQVDKESLSREKYVQSVAEYNVKNVVADVFKRSKVLKEMVLSGEVGIVGAMYSVHTGQVEFGEIATGKDAFKQD